MEKVSNAPPTTRSSPNPDGVRQAPWQWERVYSAVKTCPVCGKDFHPNIWFDQNGKPVRCQMETDWKLRKYCSRECQSMARRQLAQILNAETEYPISTTAQQHHAGASHCYKLDVAIPFLRLGIQLDGGSHFAKKIRKTDKRIREWLAELGWSVLHISNSKALELCTICKSRDTLLSMLTESWFTTAI